MCFLFWGKVPVSKLQGSYHILFYSEEAEETGNVN